MLLAVQTFNSPALQFKTENFAILANIAWTYLLHEFYDRKNIGILRKDGKYIALSEMVERQDCPLTKGEINNLKDLKEIRDAVEHKLFGQSDGVWMSLFQACCLNFDSAICRLFGERLSLRNELAFALQFAKLSMEQIEVLQKYDDIPEHIQALDARLESRLSKEEKNDLAYKFRVIYTLDNATKKTAHIHFINSQSAEAKDIRNVLVQYKLADELYPHKPSEVVKLITRKTSKQFNQHTHRQVWMFYKVRSPSRSKDPKNTDKRYCIYNPVYNAYSFSNEWVEFLSEKVANNEEFKKITSLKL